MSETQQASHGGEDVLVAALSAAAQKLGRADNEQQTLSRIVAAAVSTVPGAEQAGVSILHRDGDITSQEPSSETVATVDQLQSTYREGPCVTALWDEHTVLVDDLAAEAARWPRFAPQALAHGVRSMLSFQLFAGTHTLGAMNLYSSVVKGFTADSRVLGAARHLEQLQHAMYTRDVIGQAKGILMERFSLDAEQAFSMLVSSSQETNLKLVDVARWLTARTSSSTAGE